MNDKPARKGFILETFQPITSKAILRERIKQFIEATNSINVKIRLERVDRWHTEAKICLIFRLHYDFDDPYIQKEDTDSHRGPGIINLTDEWQERVEDNVRKYFLSFVEHNNTGHSFFFTMPDFTKPFR